MKFQITISLSLLLATLFPNLCIFAQTENDPIPIVAWKISDRLGNITPTPYDTIVLNFQNRNITDNLSTAYGYLGNLMLPGQSKIFFDRPEGERFIFIEPYRPFIVSPDKFDFTNTKIPHTNLTYNFGGGTSNKEQRFSGLFSANINKKWNVGANFDFVLANGFYSGQSAKQNNAAFFSNYLSDKYIMHTFWGINSLNHYENGGITDDRYITNPQAASQSKRPIDSKSIPVRFTDEGVRVKDRQFYLTQRYNIGFYREKSENPDSTSVSVNQTDALTSTIQLKGHIAENENDSIDTAEQSGKKNKEFVPVTGLIYTAKYNYNSRYFITEKIPDDFYPKPLLNNSATRDSTFYWSLRNTFGIALLEGFNKYAKAGLSVFIENELRNYRLQDAVSENSISLMLPTSELKHVENSTSVGAELSKRQGNLLTYDFRGEMSILGDDLGQFKLSGNIQTRFKLLRNTVNLRAYGYIKNLVPAYYLQTYRSNFFWWDNNFGNQRRIRIGGDFSLPNRGFRLNVGIENLQNYIYFDKNALPTQMKDNIQMLSAKLNQDLRFGIFNWENELVYQVSGNKNVLPLPDFSIYSNVYIRFIYAKSMTMQLGADVRLHTKYYAPTYQPATTQFYLQDEVEVGNFPLVNAYANMYLKKTRFFIMAYNLVGGNYFSLPHYPLNPFHLRMGLSVSFND